MTAALVDHLWQSTWFAALAGLLTVVLRNNDARTRYWIWFAASLKFLVPFAWLTMLGGQFSWQVSVATPMSPGALIDVVQAAGSLSTPPQLVTRAYDLNLAGALLVVWAAGSLRTVSRASPRQSDRSDSHADRDTVLVSPARMVDRGAAGGRARARVR